MINDGFLKLKSTSDSLNQVLLEFSQVRERDKFYKITLRM